MNKEKGEREREGGREREREDEGEGVTGWRRARGVERLFHNCYWK